eukprot:6211446-Pleurochrysis_carterae.AAC.2
MQGRMCAAELMRLSLGILDGHARTFVYPSRRQRARKDDHLCAQAAGLAHTKRLRTQPTRHAGTKGHRERTCICAGACRRHVVLARTVQRRRELPRKLSVLARRASSPKKSPTVRTPTCRPIHTSWVRETK